MAAAEATATRVRAEAMLASVRATLAKIRRGDKTVAAGASRMAFVRAYEVKMATAVAEAGVAERVAAQVEAAEAVVFWSWEDH